MSLWCLKGLGRGDSPLAASNSAQNVIRGLILNSCAISVGLRYRHLNQPDDLDELVKLHEEALGVLPEDHSGRSTFYKNVGRSLINICNKL